jgi:hypothetical protein
MNQTQQEMLAELRSNAQSMAQLASWQLALARDVESKLADFKLLSGAMKTDECRSNPPGDKPPG